MPDELVTVPQDLTLVSDEDLAQLEAKVTAEFTRINEGDVSPESLEYMLQLAEDLDRIRSENSARDQRRTEAAKLADLKMHEQKKALEARVKGVSADPVTRDESEVSKEYAGAIAKAAAEGATAALVAALGDDKRGGRDFSAISEKATKSLSAARRHAPSVNLPKAKLQVQAGVDIPGIARGGELSTLESVTDAFHRRAKGMPDSRGQLREELVCTIKNQFEHTVDDRTSPAQVEELFSFLRSRDKQEALVAGGGWCAPSEIRYDFFNVACESGLIDLPTFGVSRGGIRYPVSPSIADAFGSNALAPFNVSFTNTSVPWLWTEADDILTITGTTNKPTMRVPCPTFSENRLECYGVTLTAGNLTDDAYPEATQNTLRLLMSAHAHAMNARIISLMVTNSTAAITGISGTNPVYQQVLDGVDMAATDYRARYAMCDDDVLELVVPYWLKAVIRADLAWRAGTADLLSVSDAQIVGYFADRNVRPQFINDWQVRGSGQFGGTTAVVAWPTSVNVMLYAAGTFLLGNGLSLDLGVIRDSVLNAENDFTAAWSEECHLLARVGHESRLYTIGFNVKGATSATLTDNAKV